tara:strand:- start:122 stop:322 length:201 start_codon:yes stop_codon:yes gene_type:complete
MKRNRFKGTNFNKQSINKDNIIVDMNDIKSMFREYMMHKIERDFEEMVKNYFTDDVITDNNTIEDE